MPRLERSLAARAAERSSAAAKLVSTYYDTPDRALARRGLALRVRERNGRFVQTVKAGAEAGGSGLARGEWEDAVASPRPDPEAAESGQFLTPEIREGLVPLFRTEVTRRTIELAPAAGTQIEAAIDRGRIRADAKGLAERISEVELELKSGSPTALYDVALDLLNVAPVRLERRSKAERGYRLAAAEAVPRAAHAEPILLDAAISGETALQRIGFACLDQLLRDEAAVLAGSADGVHQMRVAVRRLRAILSAFSKLLPKVERRWASEELRWLAGALGPARNLDVFGSTLLASARHALSDAAAQAELVAAVEQRRRAAYRKAARVIRSTRFTALMLRLLRWFEDRAWREGDGAPALQEQIGAIAARVLERRWRAAKKHGKGFGKQSPEERHRLRIALKKLRYAAELLASLYDPGEIERFVRPLKRLQDDLGAANDVRVGHEIVAALTRPSGSNAALVAAGERVLDWHAARLAKNEPKLREHLHRLFDAEPFWRRQSSPSRKA